MMKARLLLLILITFGMVCRAAEPEHTAADSTDLQASFHRFDRGIQKLTFVPKKTWFGGASVSYNEMGFDNVNLLVVNDIQADGYTFSVGPCFGYFFKDNLAVGMRVKYNRTMVDLANFNLSLGEDFNINLKDLYYLKHGYQASAFVRSYMPLGHSRVFGFFSEFDLTYGYGQGKNLSGKYDEGSLNGTYSTSNMFHLGFSPGLAAFAQDWLAVEVQMGVMGFNFKWQDQVINQVEQGRQSNFSGKFKLDLFSISIGATIYL